MDVDDLLRELSRIPVYQAEVWCRERRVTRRGKEYAWTEKRVHLPPDFPEGTVYILSEEAFTKLEEVLRRLAERLSHVKGPEGYYVVHECGCTAHLWKTEENGKRWYYCPACNQVFALTR